MRRAALATIAAVSVVAAGPAGAGAGSRNAAAGKDRMATVVGTDPSGDWGEGAGAGDLGNALGQDLVEAAIRQESSDTLAFVISLDSLPPPGGMPEITRYGWAFEVGGIPYLLDGKFTNYSRGVCDPTAGQCPPARDPGLQPFTVSKNCLPPPAPVRTCEEVGLVKATFSGSDVSIPVPMEMIGARPGSKVAPGTHPVGGSVAATLSAFLTPNYLPFDQMTLTKTFVIPKR